MDRFVACKEKGKENLIAKEYGDAIHYYTEAYGTLLTLDAETLAENKVEVDNERSVLKTNIGLGHFGQGQIDKALECFIESQKLNPAYEKAYYRAALCLEKMGSFPDALVLISKIKQSNDPNVISLQKKLREEVDKDQDVRRAVPKLMLSLSAQNIKEISVKQKDKEEIKVEKVYGNLKEMEYELLMLTKGMENGITLIDAVYLLVELSKALMARSMSDWTSLLSESIFMRCLSVVQLALQALEGRDMEKVFIATHHSKDISDQIALFFRYLWSSLESGHKEARGLISKYPSYLSHIQQWNSISLQLKLGSDKRDHELTEFFLATVYNRTRLINQSESETLRKLEKVGIEEHGQVFAEFVERVSKVNSKHCKSFLVTFFKCIKNISGFEIYKSLFNNISHLYRDKFTFQSILIMNSIILCDYPSNLESFVKNEPLFLNSITSLIQHLTYLIDQEDYVEETVKFKLENAFQLLYLCLSNKPFIQEINKTSVAVFNPRTRLEIA